MDTNYQKEYYEKNKEAIRLKRKERYSRNKEKELERNREYYWNNKEELAVKKKEYYSNKENLPAYAAREAKRRAAKLNATPQWADCGKIKDIYAQAATTGQHVDHIVPLQNPNVCGLHCEDNLQLLEPTENLSKGNSFNG